MAEPTAEQIKELRESFLRDVDEKGDDNIHPNDLKRIKESDAYVRRFLMHHENDAKLALAMMKETCAWRKEHKANDIASVVRKDYLIEGGFFPYGKDKDGCTMFVFKCKKHVKGQRDIEEIKSAVIYWLERLDKEENGRPISLFFDMDQCGMANMDLEFTKFLITIMKEYYPYYLNYIIIFEMAWILNAAFKIIKSWMPEKARQKIKMLKKSELKEYVPVEQQLTCWGGKVDYTFSFMEPETSASPTQQAPSNKKVGTEQRTEKSEYHKASKVHFADGSEMNDAPSSSPSGDKNSSGDSSMLAVHPSSIITFVKDGSELVSTLELQNVDQSKTVSYKMKTTSPEKFRVRPSAGCLAPGSRVTINVNLLPGFQLGGLCRDKFLVMSMPVTSADLSASELADLWKNADSKDVTQHRLSCTQGMEILKNGNATQIGASISDEQAQINKLLNSVNDLSECHRSLRNEVKLMHKLQIGLIIVILIMGFVLATVIHKEFQTRDSAMSCLKEARDI